MKTKFTEQQLLDWERYEKVRQGGRHNMYFPGAMAETGLSSERYSFVMDNYSELKEAVEATDKASSPAESPASGSKPRQSR